MPTRLLLLLCLIEHVFAVPDVNCLVVNLEHVRCLWNRTGTPEANYTFTGWFHDKSKNECPNYLKERGTNVGCIQPYQEQERFNSFYTLLTDNDIIASRTLQLKSKVKLNAPTNLTVQNGSDSNLHFYWNQPKPAKSGCVKSEVRYRRNDRNWDTTAVSAGRQNYCINLPSKNSRYELQVRSKLADHCAESEYWSDWSEPVVWGSNNSTDPNLNGPMSVWMPVIYAVGAITLVLLVLMLLHHERRRIILIPVPKPSLIPPDLEDWFEFPKGLKESFKTNYNERACPVREYSYLSQSGSESSDSSSFSVTTDQTDCSITVNEPEDPSALFSSNSAIPSEEKPQV